MCCCQNRINDWLQLAVDVIDNNGKYVVTIEREKRYNCCDTCWGKEAHYEIRIGGSADIGRIVEKN
jgi:hypothetical protein